MANESLSNYLLLRWSYSTYMVTNKKKTDYMRNKLDSCLIKKIKEQDAEAQDLIKLQLKIKDSELISNYTQNINDFFERIFQVPEKLKEY